MNVAEEDILVRMEEDAGKAVLCVSHHALGVSEKSVRSRTIVKSKKSVVSSQIVNLLDGHDCVSSENVRHFKSKCKT